MSSQRSCVVTDEARSKETNGQAEAAGIEKRGRRGWKLFFAWIIATVAVGGSIIGSVEKTVNVFVRLGLLTPHEVQNDHRNKEAD
jgi:hypothetical protein